MHRNLVIALFLFVANQIIAQDNQKSVLDSKVSIYFDNASLPSALRQLNREVDLNFSYNSNIIPRDIRISELYQDVRLGDLLNEILTRGNLYYREVQGTIIILKRVFNERSISGKIVDQETQEPLPFANVFIDNSTLGVATDINGEFEIENIPDIGFNLVVSYVGYESKTIFFNYKQEVKDDNILIELKIDPVALESIQVTAKRKSRSSRRERKLLKRFEEEFLGKSENADDCNIVNPEVLNFETIGDTDNYRVTAEDILFIENYALGYRVGYLLDEFLFTDGTKINIGQAKFQELEPRSRRQYRKWEEAREEAYYGSVQHFLYALIKDSLNAEGFKLNVVQYDSVTSEYTTPLNPPPVKDIIQIEKTGKDFLYLLKASQDVEVTYINEFEADDYKKLYRSSSKSGNYKYTDKKARSSIALADNQSLTSYQVFGLDLEEVELFQKSIIFFEAKETPISFPGQFLNPRDVNFGGWWRWGAFSDVLPLNYRPN